MITAPIEGQPFNYDTLPVPVAMYLSRRMYDLCVEQAVVLGQHFEAAVADATENDGHHLIAKLDPQAVTELGTVPALEKPARVYRSDGEEPTELNHLVVAFFQAGYLAAASKADQQIRERYGASWN